MELRELILLSASALLAGRVRTAEGYSRAPVVTIPSDQEIEAAVRSAQRVWDEVIRENL